MLEFATPTWFEKPHLVVPDIRRLMSIGGDHVPDLKRKQLAEARKEAEKEVLSRGPDYARFLHVKFIETRITLP